MLKKKKDKMVSNGPPWCTNQADKNSNIQKPVKYLRWWGILRNMA